MLMNEICDVYFFLNLHHPGDDDDDVSSEI